MFVRTRKYSPDLRGRAGFCLGLTPPSPLKEMFLNHLYGGMDEPELKIIDVFICKLRQKLATVTGRQHIETVWGGGYVLREPHEADERIPA